VNLTERNEKIEAFVESKPRRLVKGGCVELENLENENISREEVFMGLREGGICTLKENGPITLLWNLLRVSVAARISIS
jgi:uncharacterized membrane protein YcaP (DUF421 family)